VDISKTAKANERLCSPPIYFQMANNTILEYIHLDLSVTIYLAGLSNNNYNICFLTHSSWDQQLKKVSIEFIN